MSDLQIKRGDTFNRTCRYVKSGSPSAFPEGTTIRAQVRAQLPLDDEGTTLISELVITPNDDQELFPGFYKISKAYDVEDGTNAWPVGNHLLEVEYTFPDRRTSSRTFTLQVDADVTHD